MATKKTTTKKAAPAKKPAKKTTTTAPKKAKGEAKPQGPRHPKGRVEANHQGKEALAKALASSLAHGDESADSLAGRLKTASNTQLLRLQRVVETVKQKWGSRDKLIQAITDSSKSGKDKDYVAKLGTLSLPHLVDLATAVARRARA
jgi:hypothetical protein